MGVKVIKAVSMCGVLGLDGEPDEWEVKFILIVFLHGRNVEARPLELHVLAFLPKTLDDILQLLAFEQVIGPK